ncbi:uncharacterized protein [Anabrus simplex]|uniref:uncharacterized protein n=1 Tax=Anabrus simplex TaxID=316456 RepID=UPI0034DD0374
MSLVQADRDTYLMNGRMIYNSVIESPWSMDILIEKCESVHNPDSCELWFTYNVPDLCPKLPEKNQVWSNFIEKINMSTHCPMEPNEYIIKDVPIDSSNMQRIPMGKAAFRFHVNSKSKSKVAACIDSEVEIVPEMNKGIGK